MTSLKQWYTAKELAGVPGMPATPRGVIAWDKKGKITGRDRSAGKGREYALASLPSETRAYLLDRHISTLPEKVSPLPAPASPAPPSPAALKEWQRECMDARVALMRLIEEARSAGFGMEEALTDLLSAASGRVPEVAELGRRANKRAGAARALSRSTLYRWWRVWQALKDPAALAPKDTEDTDLPPWAPAFLELYCTPQKPSVQAVLEKMGTRCPPDAVPDKSHVYRFLKKYSALDILKGRMTGAELSRHTPFTRRDTSELLPLQVCIVDGHTFKAKVAHPKHGRPFSPEVCTVIDAATRFIPGWSAGLAESNQTVADAVRHALTVNDAKPYGGMITILYSDKGAGNTAGVNADPVLGRFTRLGMRLATGRPGHPRARGIIEIVNKTLWIPLAKELPTYTGKDMDAGVARKVYLHLQSCVREAKKAGARPDSPLLISWDLFLEALSLAVEKYNNRPHSALPKIRDPETGRLRHMTPREAWDKALEGGWRPETVPERELEDLFRPWVTATTRNGEVRLFGNIYFSRDLQHYHGRKVIVEYEVQDGSRVRVRDMEHRRLICEAGFEANKRAYFPKSAVDQADEDRRRNRLASAKARIEEIEAEYNGVARPAVKAHPPELAEARRLLAQEMDAPAAGVPAEAAPRPKVVSFEAESERQTYKRWKALKERITLGEMVSEEEYRFYRGYGQSPLCRAFMDLDEARAAMKK